MLNKCHSLPLVAAIAMTMVMASCGSTRTALRAERDVTATEVSDARPSSPSAVPAGSTLAPAGAKLLTEAQSWLGVPYLYGGNDRRGVDCSGLMVQVFQNALDIKLPRTSVTQDTYCRNLDREALEPGDLVFFDTSRSGEGKVTHVGLYVGDGRFIHSSTSRGVVTSSLSEGYYNSRLLRGGRVERYEAMVKATPAPAPFPLASPESRPHPDVAATPAVTPQADPAPLAAAPVRTMPAPSPRPAPTSRPALTDDPRTAVLNSLVEEKLDSIFSSL